MKRSFPAVLLLITVSAAARDAEDALALIRTPHNGFPAVILPGGTFDAVLSEKAELRLVDGDKGVALAVTGQPLLGGKWQAECTVPLDVPPGSYVLEARTDTKQDRTVRAVFVRDKFAEYYVLAHVTDTHVGSNRNAQASEDIFRNVIKAVNTSQAALVLVTGDVTDGGEIEQFRAFINILDTCTLPTFVCAGNHDRQALNYERFFEPDTYLFRFAQDGYISFDTKDSVVADELGPQNADLEVFRRAIKPCRWSIGLSHRYEPDMGMRSQLTLFVDDPLDYFIFGHWHRANREDEKKVPWGTTPIVVTPAAINGAIRLIDVSPLGIRPRTPQYVADVD
ncbi:MAG: metallophosphoesterase [Candidatus Hydrogenedentes bacterium]|nr:metallophosphoesterase [Candidatus Hydrogenedentota bacterium]